MMTLEEYNTKPKCERCGWLVEEHDIPEVCLLTMVLDKETQHG